MDGPRTPPENSPEGSSKKPKSANSAASAATDDNARSSLLRHQRFLAFYLNPLEGARGDTNSQTLHLRDAVKGNIERAVVFNYLIEPDWLVKECPVLKEVQQLVVLHGEGREKDEELRALGLKGLKIHRPPLPLQYGTHHSKGMLLFFPNGIRVIITTGNFIARDWSKKTQGTWCQDFPKKSPESLQSTSDFEDSLVQYFRKTGGFDPAPLKDYDFSMATAALVSSVPGYHTGDNISRWGHMRVRSLLSKEPIAAEYEKATIVSQYSSMGSLTEKWLTTEFMTTLASGRGLKQHANSPPLRIVFPSVSMIQNSLEGYPGGSSVPVPKKNWKDFLKRVHGQDTLCNWDGGSGVKWRSGGAVGRQRSVPHIKTYTRFLPAHPHRIPWFLLTSANLSKAAWGELQKDASQLAIRSYELGLLFLPSLLKNAPALLFSLTPESPLYQGVPVSQPEKVTFHTTATPVEEEGEKGELKVFFPVPYTLPPEKYEKGAEPWSVDGKYLDPDLFGQTWRAD